MGVVVVERGMAGETGKGRWVGREVCNVASGSPSSTAGRDCTGGSWSLYGLYPCCLESNRVCLFSPLFFFCYYQGARAAGGPCHEQRAVHGALLPIAVPRVGGQLVGGRASQVGARIVVCMPPTRLAGVDKRCFACLATDTPCWCRQALLCVFSHRHALLVSTSAALRV